MIYRCKSCGGLYKYVYSAVYETRNFDSEEGWNTLVDHYYKVEEAGISGIPFSIDEARTYGYTGRDFTMSGGRCGYGRQANGLTCRFSNLFEVATIDKATWIKRCVKCGQIYKQVREPSMNRFYKPGDLSAGTIVFTLQEAIDHGFHENPADRRPGD